MTTRPEFYDDELEENQWAVVWATPSVDDESENAKAIVYVREKPAPADVKIWRGDGERDLYLEAMENRYEEGNPDSLVPFLFQAFLRGFNYFEYGKLDDESKAMLKEKFNIDVDKDD